MAKPFRVLSTPPFERNIKELDSKIQNQILNALEKLQEDPYNLKREADIRKIAGAKLGTWRLRVGSYRIRYDIKEQNVILRASHPSLAGVI